MGDGASPDRGMMDKIFQAGSRILTGESLFLATMKGTGKVWLQSMPIRKLIRALAPMGVNRGKEASGLLGNLF
jgi:uncharacterized protein (AIM24 family)